MCNLWKNTETAQSVRAADGSKKYDMALKPEKWQHISDANWAVCQKVNDKNQQALFREALANNNPDIARYIVLRQNRDALAKTHEDIWEMLYLAQSKGNDRAVQAVITAYDDRDDCRMMEESLRHSFTVKAVELRQLQFLDFLLEWRAKSGDPQVVSQMVKIAVENGLAGTVKKISDAHTDNIRYILPAVFGNTEEPSDHVKSVLADIFDKDNATYFLHNQIDKLSSGAVDFLLSAGADVNAGNDDLVLKLLLNGKREAAENIFESGFSTKKFSAQTIETLYRWSDNATADQYQAVTGYRDNSERGRYRVTGHELLTDTTVHPAGGKLTVTFNFATRQQTTAIVAERAPPMNVQTFDDLGGDRAFEKMYDIYLALGGKEGDFRQMSKPPAKELDSPAGFRLTR